MRHAFFLLRRNKMKRAFMQIILVVLAVIGLYAAVRCIIDPNWYFGKDFVPEYVTQETFWDYVIGGAK